MEDILFSISPFCKFAFIIKINISYKMFGIGMVAYCTNLPPEVPIYQIDAGFYPSCSSSNTVPYWWPGKAVEDTQNLRSCIHTRYPEEILGSQPHTGLSLAINAIWRVNQRIELFVSPSLSVTLIPSKINVSLKKCCLSFKVVSNQGEHCFWKWLMESALWPPIFLATNLKWLFIYNSGFIFLSCFQGFI